MFPSYVREVLNCDERARVMSAKFLTLASLPELASKLLVSKEIGRDNVRENLRPAVFHNAHLRPTSNPHEYSNLAGLSN